MEVSERPSSAKAAVRQAAELVAAAKSHP